MGFTNFKAILRSDTGLDRFKLLLMAAMFSRPWSSGVARILLRPFVHHDEVKIRFRDRGRRYEVFVRMSDLNSDYVSVLELVAADVYPLDPKFLPDLVIDGGGNIGMFTLRADASFPYARKVVCEPVLKNLAQIQRHFALNHVDAEIKPVCIGGPERTIPFFVREANQGSFDDAKPYQDRIDVPVVQLRDLASGTELQRILIKLDIEGMEIEALEAYVPGETRAVCIHGELHDHKTNKQHMQRIFGDCGWSLTFRDETDAGSLFKAVSPAASAQLSTRLSNRLPELSELH